MKITVDDKVKLEGYRRGNETKEVFLSVDFIESGSQVARFFRTLLPKEFRSLVEVLKINFSENRCPTNELNGWVTFINLQFQIILNISQNEKLEMIARWDRYENLVSLGKKGDNPNDLLYERYIYPGRYTKEFEQHPKTIAEVLIYGVYLKLQDYLHLKDNEREKIKRLINVLAPFVKKELT